MSVRNENTPSAALRDRLTGALISLARVTDGNEHLISKSSTEIILEGLAATADNASCDCSALEQFLNRVTEEKRKMVPDCFTCASPCGKNNDYDMQKLWTAEENVRSMKLRILSGIRSMAAHARRTEASGYPEEAVISFLYKGLIVLGMDDWGTEELAPIVRELEDMKLKSVALPDA